MIKTVITFFKDLWYNRRLIVSLSVNDFKTRYAGSMMGVFWAFVQPVITVLVYWFVFEKGLRAGRQAMGGVEVPFVLFLIFGLFFARPVFDSLSAGLEENLRHRNHH